MKDTITNAAEITILQPIDNNYKTGGGDISVGGAVVVATKGKPFTPTRIYGGTTDIEDNFGKPLPSKIYGMEGLRHVHDASESCSYVNAVRVVNALTYRYPSLSFLVAREKGGWDEGIEFKAGDIVEFLEKKWLCAYPHVSSKDNFPEEGKQTDWLPYTGATANNGHRYNEEIVVGDGAFMAIYPIDGDSSVNRTVAITNIDKEAQRFTLSIYDKDSLGEEYLLEQHVVGVGEDDKDDMGLPILRRSFNGKATGFAPTTWKVWPGKILKMCFWQMKALAQRKRSSSLLAAQPEMSRMFPTGSLA